VELDQSFRERLQVRKLHAYMYGESIIPPPGVTSFLLGNEIHTDLGLSPTSTVIAFGDLAIYRIGEGLY
jgi:polyribonucleotide 5'-hydroxyl-kinase